VNHAKAWLLNTSMLGMIAYLVVIRKYILTQQKQLLYEQPVLTFKFMHFASRIYLSLYNYRIKNWLSFIVKHYI